MLNPNLNLRDLSFIFSSIRVNLERIEKEKKKSRSKSDKLSWQYTIDEYTKVLNKVEVLEKSLEKRLLRDNYETDVKLSGLW
jgi:hypothetical protein